MPQGRDWQGLGDVLLAGPFLNRGDRERMERGCPFGWGDCFLRRMMKLLHILFFLRPLLSRRRRHWA
ncbi:hypothetical protein B4135_2964 [Caldibacillus debilis]|uniref:Uncharacterized protein n=1 Tax=Caldibacillus debilis TaxID=301148 RepID=A0A150LLL1_9BACI|nr:hypothetical protein B4135_2964 [Caldibacillus debilis]